MNTITAIRSKAIELLEAANIAGGRIYDSRVSPTFLTNTPAMCVFTDQVQATQYDVEPPVFTRVLTLQLEIIVANSSSGAEVADSIVSDSLTTLFGNAQFYELFSTIKSYEVTYNYSGEATTPTVSALVTIAGSIFESY